jgi:hypothetical protein
VDGLTLIRNTCFEYYGEDWRHRFGQQYHLLSCLTSPTRSSSQPTISLLAGRPAASSKLDGGDGQNASDLSTDLEDLKEWFLENRTNGLFMGNREMRRRVRRTYGGFARGWRTT